jgi:hypothetical protein
MLIPKISRIGIRSCFRKQLKQVNLYQNLHKCKMTTSATNGKWTNESTNHGGNTMGINQHSTSNFNRIFVHMETTTIPSYLWHNMVGVNSTSIRSLPTNKHYKLCTQMHLILIQSIVPNNSSLFSNYIHIFISLLLLFHYFQILDYYWNPNMWSYFEYYS